MRRKEAKEKHKDRMTDTAPKPKCQKQAPSHTKISIGKKELELLRYMFYHQESRLNIKAYSRSFKVKRSTVYYLLDNLINSGFVTKPYTANHTITKKGIDAVDSLKGSATNIRGECRNKDVRENYNLSVHYHEFKSKIEDRTNFNISKVKELNPNNYKENKLFNLYQIIVYFDDATVLINPIQLIIRIKDIVSKDVNDSDFKSLEKALNYANKLSEIGVVCKGMLLETAHFARIESLLSDFLQKIDDRYFIDLGDGKKFWIDHSNNKREDETNDKEVRGRVDNFMNYIAKNDVDLSDIDKITKTVGMMAQIESARLIDKYKQVPEPKNLIPKEKPDYFG